MNTDNVICFTDAEKINRAKEFFEEYRNLARLVDDLDIRFWKRYALRDCMRESSIDTDLSEERLRKEYRSCVADLILLRGQVYSAIDDVVSTISRELILEFYVRDIPISELQRKWGMPGKEIMKTIRSGLKEAKIPDRNHGEKKPNNKPAEKMPQKERTKVMGMSFIDQVDKKGTECCVHSVRDGNGTLIRYEVETGEDKEHFADLTNEEKTKVLAWLRYNLIPAANVLEGHSSYGMKHILERRTGIYMTNNMFKEAALVCGFLPAVVDELNWRFRVRKTSPMFMRQTDGETGLPMMGERMDYSKSAGLKVINLDE